MPRETTRTQCLLMDTDVLSYLPATDPSPEVCVHNAYDFTCMEFEKLCHSKILHVITDQSISPLKCIAL